MNLPRIGSSVDVEIAEGGYILRKSWNTDEGYDSVHQVCVTVDEAVAEVRAWLEDLPMAH